MRLPLRIQILGMCEHHIQMTLFLSFKWNGSLYIYPESTHSMTDWMTHLCPHNAHLSHLKNVPGFRGCFFVFVADLVNILKFVVLKMKIFVIFLFLFLIERKSFFIITFLWRIKFLKGHLRNFKNKHFRGDYTLVKILHYISYLNCAHFIFIVISKLNILNIGFQDKLKSRLVCTSSLLLSIKVCKRLQSKFFWKKEKDVELNSILI